MSDKTRKVFINAGEMCSLFPFLCSHYSLVAQRHNPDVVRLM